MPHLRTPLLSLRLRHDQDVVTARQRAGDIAMLLGFDAGEQTRIATAVSEIARNAFRYAGAGDVECQLDCESHPQALAIVISDAGKGIPQLDRVLSGRYKSSSGLGLGILAARRLMDGLDVDSTPAGTRIELRKALPPRAPVLNEAHVGSILRAIHSRQPAGLAEEFQRQNQELLRALDELQTRHDELVRLNRELEDTNRGVVALYAELDEKADHVRRADELKSRFLSNMTHEFRTPVNSIIGLCNLLLEGRRREGREADQEIVYIRKAAEQLSDLVNDLLDLAKVQAGKTSVQVALVDVSSLFGALRAMLRPLLRNQSVALVFDIAADLPPLSTDEAKISQILRNLISNALKFTERGEVRVLAAPGPDADHIVFSVADTGIGIAPQDQQRIFEEFTQVEHRLQGGVRGTGLGLSLSKRLAELLGGTIAVDSEPGVGSTFTLTLPAVHPSLQAARRHGARTAEHGSPSQAARVLVIDDEEISRYLITQALDGAYDVTACVDAEHGMREARARAADVIVLDLILPDVSGWDVLDALHDDATTRDLPVIVVTGSALDPAGRAHLLRHARDVISKADLTRERLVGAIAAAVGR